jgi:arginine decarboxylase
MKIYLTTGVGFGKTPISAFDSALRDAGVDNFNLLTLSSVVPPGAEVVFEKYVPEGDQWGNKLYCVMAEIRTRESGQFIGAALGWYQLDDGRGVFVEHMEKGETQEAVEANLKEEIHQSLTDMCNSRNIPVEEDRLKMKMSIARVEDSSASVLVVAAYKSDGWE